MADPVQVNIIIYDYFLLFIHLYLSGFKQTTNHNQKPKTKNQKPITTNNQQQEVKQIYSHFDYEFSEEFENNLRNYLIENRRYKKGRLRYSMEEFRLSTLQVCGCGGCGCGWLFTD